MRGSMTIFGRHLRRWNVPCHLISTCTSIKKVWKVLPPEDPTKNGFTPNDHPSLRNLTPNRSNSAFGFVEGIRSITEMKVDMSDHPSLRNLAPNRSNSAFAFILRLTWLTYIKVDMLYLTGITSGATTRVYETWRPTVQIWRLVLSDLPSLRNMGPNRSNLAFGSNVSPEFTKHASAPWFYEMWHIAVHVLCLFCGGVKVFGQNLEFASSYSHLRLGLVDTQQI
ncbi:uncharacterized protein LACBIDRAFT_332697 [Laccaria bicolor S238N-H82]|uniref:Predicted protein n=1 Tax=Laccaria bicolor (strain S238N-H82 / ATCC MYA-4686) TaxID=486041 RepID=B0DTK7_LACBS|nr:uncharacterized protein LACBIDRAFT_332697 [Laccaria bicolor S238N-H82]EDR02132.1 predicted protein [Laccaria bicolor S238N-H82]|eukprot:XP_001887289.1 predicted protein [Laccaria bicolor S238N-H82]